MKKLPTKIFFLFVNFITIIILYTNSYAAKSTITRVDGPFAPEVKIFNEKEEAVFLDQFEGKTILISFWATWCGPCSEELPSLDVLQKDFRKLPFEIISVSEDFNGIEIAKKYFKQNEIRHLKLYYDHKNMLFSSMSVVGLPTSFLIDQDGRIKIIFKGNTKWYDDKIRELIISEIPGNYPMPKNSYKVTSLNRQLKPKIIKKIDKNIKNEIKNGEKTNENNS